MPHITIDYTANLEAEITQSGLVDTLHQAAIGTGIFPLWGIRTLAQPHTDYRVAGGEAGNGFIKVARGRAQELDVAAIQRKDIGLHIVDGDDMNVLGMNFLSTLSRWSVEGRWLILQA